MNNHFLDMQIADQVTNHNPKHSHFSEIMKKLVRIQKKVPDIIFFVLKEYHIIGILKSNFNAI